MIRNNCPAPETLTTPESHPWRTAFPAVQHNAGVYLDSAATTHKPIAVIEAVQQVYTHENAPVHRGLYGAAELATQDYEETRALVATWIGAHTDEIVFTYSATDSINLIAHSWAAQRVQPGDEIVITELEHHANSLPWVTLAQQPGATVNTVICSDGDRAVLAQRDIVRAITHNTKLVAVAPYSNVRGPLTDSEMRTIVARTRAVGAALLIDAAQVPAHAQIDVRQWNPDFLVFSGHKCFAPTGIGVLYVHRSRHQQLRPYRIGGGMVYDALPTVPQWKSMPALLEAGSPPLEAVKGLGAAIRFIQDCSYTAIRAHERQLMTQLIDGIRTIPGMRIIGDSEFLKQHSSLVSFSIDGIHAHDLAAFLAAHGIAVRAGHHCCQRLHQRIKLESSLRISCALYNNAADIERTIDILFAAAAYFRE